jgi:hypothetical protein
VAACEARISPSTASAALFERDDCPRGGCSRPVDTQTDEALFTLSALAQIYIMRPTRLMRQKPRADDNGGGCALPTINSFNEALSGLLFDKLML